MERDQHLILKKVMESKTKPNARVTYLGKIGVVMLYDKLNYTLHVAVQKNTYTWIIEKWPVFATDQAPYTWRYTPDLTDIFELGRPYKYTPFEKKVDEEYLIYLK